MGNVNEAHEREAESSDDIESSGSECDTSSHSATSSSEQEIVHISEDAHLIDSIMSSSLEICPATSNNPEQDNLINEELPDGDNSLPLSESILPTSFDLLEGSNGEIIFGDVQDKVLTPDVSYDDVERKADSQQDAHIVTPPQVEGENIEQTQDKIALCIGNEFSPEEDHLPDIVAETLPNQVDAVSQALCSDGTRTNEFKPEKSAQRTIDYAREFFAAENSSLVESSSSMILNDGMSFIAYINPDKSESGMTSLAEHFDAISLEESQIQPLEKKKSGHAIPKDSEYTLAETSHGHILLDPEDSFLPSGLSMSHSKPDTNGFPTSGGLATEYRGLGSSHKDLLEENIQKMPLLQFDLSKGNLEENTNHASITAKDTSADSLEQMEPALVLTGGPMTLDIRYEPNVLNNGVPTCVEQVLAMHPENLSPVLKAHSPPKHTADRPNWALAPDLPLKSQSSSSIKQRKRGPRRGKRPVNDSGSARLDALNHSSKQRNSSAGSDAPRQPRKDIRPGCDLSKAVDIPNASSPHEILPTPHLTEHGSMHIPMGCNTGMIAETSNNFHQTDTVDLGVPREIPDVAANVSQSTTNTHHSVSSHANGVHHSNEPSKVNADPIPFGHEDTSIVKPSPASEHDVATAMGLVGSSVGLPSKDAAGANPYHEPTENGLDQTVSSTFSMTPYISGESLPKSSWPSLEEEIRFHAVNRSFQSAIHHSSKPFTPEEIPILTVCQNSFLERDPVIHRTSDNGPDAFTAVTKTRHVVVEESVAISGEGARNARVHIPTNRSETIDLEATLHQGPTRPSGPPFQSGIPIPSRRQFHRNSYINLPRSRIARLSVPEEIVHDISSQTFVLQNASRACSLSQMNRDTSQPLMTRNPIATSGHPNGPMPTITSDRDSIFLPEPSSKPSKPVPASRYPVRPRANPPYSYSTPIIDIHENSWEHDSRYQPRFESTPYTRGFTRPHREERPMSEFYSSGSGSSNVRRRLN